MSNEPAPPPVPSFAIGSASPRQGYNRDRYIVTPVCGGRGQLPSSTGTLYTAPSTLIAGAASAKAVLRELILANRTAGGARTVTIYVVESGGTANAARAILQDVVIPDGDSWTMSFYMPLESGETIQGKCDAASIITYRVSVDEYT